MSSILKILALTPSAASIDYVDNKQQFQLYSLLTEQKHPQTTHLSYQISQDTHLGLRSLLTVDHDITKKFKEIAASPVELKNLEDASKAIQTAILNNYKIYFYGTGSTGRLAETIESFLWRPFWEKLAQTPIWHPIKAHFPDIQNRLIGEITGGDRALISSLEGFEDLQLIGKLQLNENKIQKGDVVFAVTEGGETSAVIGTILAAAELYAGGLHTEESWQNLYFIYNNPDSLLLPFTRSRAVLENPLIKKINLTTGPQAITGSTRMQATTTSLYVSGIIVEDAIYHVLQHYLSPLALKQIGFDETSSIKKRLLDFSHIQKIIHRSAIKIAPWTDVETNTYTTQHRVTYMAQKALLPVFVDVTERSPTFRLAPLDPINLKHSWIQVWTTASTQQTAWDILLHRPFHGLDTSFYQQSFTENIDDPYLRETALDSLAHAGQEQQNLYDLAFSSNNIQHNSPAPDDLGVIFLLADETLTPTFSSQLQLFTQNKANLVVVSVASNQLPVSQVTAYKKQKTNTRLLHISIPDNGPFQLNQLIGLKMLLNAHSTAVMAKLGRLVGNTMTAVQPSNLKLIGRATYLIQLHVNDVLNNPAWIKIYGNTAGITFAEANAVLYDAMTYVQKGADATQSPEVELAIVRILESLKYQKNIAWQQAAKILKEQSLEQYLSPYLTDANH